MSGDLAKTGAAALLAGTAMPTTLYLKAHIGNPGDSGLNNAAVETTRKAVTLAAPSVVVAGNYDALSSAQVQWLNVAATETWTHLSYWSAASGGTCWFIDDITDTPVVAGQTVSIDVGSAGVRFPFWT